MTDSSTSNGKGATTPARASQAGGRSLRPFKLRPLTGAVALVNVRAMTLNEIMVDLASDQPWEVIPWQQRLGNLMTCLEALEEAALEARHVCAELFESAPADHAIAQRAALAVLRSS